MKKNILFIGLAVLVTKCETTRTSKELPKTPLQIFTRRISPLIESVFTDKWNQKELDTQTYDITSNQNSIKITRMQGQDTSKQSYKTVIPHIAQKLFAICGTRLRQLNVFANANSVRIVPIDNQSVNDSDEEKE